MTSTLARKPQWQRLFLRAARLSRETVKAFLKALTQPDPMEWETHRSSILTARREALMAYEAAVRRGDTRGMHDAFKVVRDATNDLLRAEVAR